MPEWILAAFIVPVAVIVLRVILTASFESGVALEPFIESIDCVVLPVFTADVIPVAVVPVWVFAAQSILIAVVVVAVWILIIAVRIGVLPAIEIVVKSLISGAVRATFIVPVAVVPIWISTVHTIYIAMIMVKTRCSTLHSLFIFNTC